MAQNYQRFKHLFYLKHEKKPKTIKGLEGMYSLKRLSEVILDQVWRGQHFTITQFLSFSINFQTPNQGLFINRICYMNSNEWSIIRQNNAMKVDIDIHLLFL